MIAERTARIGAEAAAAWALGFLLRDQGHGAVETDVEDFLGGIEIGVGLAVLHIRAVAADAG